MAHIFFRSTTLSKRPVRIASDFLPNGGCHVLADGWQWGGRRGRTRISLFFPVRIARFGSTISCIFGSFQWPILRTRPPADRARQPLKNDRLDCGRHVREGDFRGREIRISHLFYSSEPISYSND